MVKQSVEQRFKRRARKKLRERWPDLKKRQITSIVDDVWIWFVEHRHADMSKSAWCKILKKNGILVE